MSQKWDRLDWVDGGGMARVGLGTRAIPWPSYSGTGLAGTANATCSTCGGRMRGARQCSCDSPDWRVRGEPLAQNANIVRMQAQQEWHTRWLEEGFKVLVPTGHIKIFGGTRTFHRLGSAMASVGFQDIRLEAWNYKNGFPKSLNVGKAVDGLVLHGRSDSVGLQQANGDRPGEGRVRASTMNNGKKNWVGASQSLGAPRVIRDEPATEEAQKWSQWGTALKPAWEPQPPPEARSRDGERHSR